MLPDSVFLLNALDGRKAQKILVQLGNIALTTPVQLMGLWRFYNIEVQKMK